MFKKLQHHHCLASPLWMTINQPTKSSEMNIDPIRVKWKFLLWKWSPLFSLTDEIIHFGRQWLQMPRALGCYQKTLYQMETLIMGVEQRLESPFESDNRFLVYIASFQQSFFLLFFFLPGPLTQQPGIGKGSKAEKVNFHLQASTWFCSIHNNKLASLKARLVWNYDRLD